MANTAAERGGQGGQQPPQEWLRPPANDFAKRETALPAAYIRSSDDVGCGSQLPSGSDRGTMCDDFRSRGRISIASTGSERFERFRSRLKWAVPSAAHAPAEPHVSYPSRPPVGDRERRFLTRHGNGLAIAASRPSGSVPGGAGRLSVAAPCASVRDRGTASRSLAAAGSRCREVGPAPPGSDRGTVLLRAGPLPTA